jgi:hypothetical protein
MREQDVFSGYSVSGSNVVFLTAPPLGTFVKITVLTEDYTTTDVTHPVGSTVIDASVTQRIPGGYNWIPAPVGLQRSGTQLARFLLNKPGTTG